MVYWPAIGCHTIIYVCSLMPQPTPKEQTISERTYIHIICTRHFSFIQEERERERPCHSLFVAMASSREDDRELELICLLDAVDELLRRREELAQSLSRVGIPNDLRAVHHCLRI